MHASVTVRDGYAQLFLGHSGTGKSTHSRLWQEAYPDAWLLNDDNPVLRVLPDGEVRVYGSPWSGKTPCYKNQSAPVRGIVKLSQAPHNEIRLLRLPEAYAYMLASSSGLKIVPEMMDRLYETIAKTIQLVPVYGLECLPNTDAARLCHDTLTK
jgi:energy-coupling factor transporter ATP-binding protein EcfA2